MKKLTKQQMKNRKLLAESLTSPLKSKEQIQEESKKFQEKMKKLYG
jgi:hypothetical protein